CFHAEDGIRDRNVTGVQTCALPICALVDVGSIEFLHRRLLDERDKGTPVVIVSTELDEVVQLADRIAVMYRGGILGIVPGDEDRSEERRVGNESKWRDIRNTRPDQE